MGEGWGGLVPCKQPSIGREFCNVAAGGVSTTAVGDCAGSGSLHPSTVSYHSRIQPRRAPTKWPLEPTVARSGQQPLAHASGKHHGEVILQCRRWWIFDDCNTQLCWEWLPCTDATMNLLLQIREQVQLHRTCVDVTLRRASTRARR